MTRGLCMGPYTVQSVTSHMGLYTRLFMGLYMMYTMYVHLYPTHHIKQDQVKLKLEELSPPRALRGSCTVEGISVGRYKPGSRTFDCQSSSDHYLIRVRKYQSAWKAGAGKTEEGCNGRRRIGQTLGTWQPLIPGDGAVAASAATAAAGNGR
ncbi:hypothetical protein C0Q70_18252 [Pomacea canaliculata]|uniref:Uncharacterized protein n=1 Tax=Pomacea canaliculata TaxID=400727 RepID=A0A2T7NMP3_POMCA|nr:hypothetical protein C0Q70_18252 [Pomacea canaliculata]